MVKKSLFWGQASGKLGEAVYYRAKGEQRTRTYVGKIANPKTDAQMRNRVSMGNLTATYRVLKPILSGSFSDKNANESDYNAFMRKSKTKNSPAVIMDSYKDGIVCPFNMAISSGVLDFPYIPSFVKARPDEISQYGYDCYAIRDAFIANGITPESALGDKMWAGTATGDDYYKAIIGDNNPSNLPTDFNLFIIIGQSGDEAGWYLGGYKLHVAMGESESWKLVAGTDVRVDLALPKLLVPADVDLSIQQNVTSYALLVHAEAESKIKKMMIGCFISSRQTGKLQCSTSKFKTELKTNEDPLSLFLPGGEQYNMALAELRPTGTPVV